MFKNHFSAILGIAAVFAVAAMPADAADDIEVAAQVCSACHGEHGEPQDKTTPIIWGQQEYFLVKQMHDYKSGDRENPVMSTMSQTLTQADLRQRRQLVREALGRRATVADRDDSVDQPDRQRRQPGRAQSTTQTSLDLEISESSRGRGE